MKMSRSVFSIVLLMASSVLAFAQEPPPAGGPQVVVAGPPQGGIAGEDISAGPGRQISISTAGGVMIRREMGKWWQDSELAKKLGLSESQITQLNKIFYNHRLKLIDDGAEMEKADLKLQTLLDEDAPNESQVSAQVDQVLAARGSLEREYTMMNLDLRKALTIEQWRHLKSIRGERGPESNVFFYKKLQPGPGPEALPLPPMPPPGPGSSDMF